MSNILTYGTFDLLHRGHLNILKSAAKLGNKLFVGVSTDDFNKQRERLRSSRNLREEMLWNLLVL